MTPSGSIYLHLASLVIPLGGPNNISKILITKYMSLKDAPFPL